jgi:hypothetical protein
MAGLRNLMIRLGIEVDPSGASQGMSKLQGLMEKASATVGIGAGVALAGGLVQAMDLSASRGKLQAQLGVTTQESKRIGDVAGKLFANAYGDSMTDVNTAVTAVIQNMDGMRKASSAALEQTTARAITTGQVLGEDVGRVTASVAQLMRTGLAKNSNEAFDILTRGAQLGGNKAQDLLDTMNEYPTQFRKLGISGQMAMGIISQGMKAGARDSDLVADSLKEFSIRAVDGSKLTTAGFKMIGLNASDMAKKIGAGGKTATAALDLTLDRLRGIKDPVKQSQAAVALFGTQAEDLGAALFKLDPSKAVAALGSVGGAADKAGKAMGETAAARFETFKRTLQTNVVGAIDSVISKFNALDPATQATITKIGTIAAIALPAGVAIFKIGSAAVTATRGIVGFVSGSAQFVGGLIRGSAALGENASAAAKFGGAIRGAGPAMMNFGRMMGQGLVTSAQLVTSMSASAAATARYGLAAAGAATKTVLMTAAQKASQVASKLMAAGVWLVNLAMRANPIGLIITLITGLVAIIVIAYKKNETFRKIVDAVWKGIQAAISFAWNKVIKPVLQALWSFIVNTLAPKFLWFHNNIVMPVFRKIGTFIGAAIKIVKGHFDFMVKLVTQTVPNAFRSGVSAIGRFWDKVKEIAKKPISFVVNTVYNKGIARVWNWVASKVNLPQLPYIQGFAKGGILPGFSRKDNQIIAARSGEGILVPEAVKELGSDFIMHANKKGGLSAIADLLGFAGDPGALSIPGFEGGGIVGFVKSFIGKAKDFFVNGFMKAARAALNPIVQVMKNTIGGTPIGQLISSAIEKIVSGTLGRFTSFENELGGGGGMKAVHAARSQIGVPYSWGGGGPGGPSYGIQQGANIRGFDCSGLTEYAWWQALHKSIGGTTYEQKRIMKPISGPRPGAVGQPHPGHTYIANEKGGIIEAPFTGARVREVGMRHTPTWLWPPWSFDNGGVWEPGTAGVNGTREPEYVFTRRQMQSGFAPKVEVHVHVDPITGKSTYKILKDFKRSNGNRSLDL